MFDETTLDETCHSEHGLLADDAAFLAAEQRVAELCRLANQIPDDEDPDGDLMAEILRPVNELRDQIAASPAVSLLSAAVKLRDLLHPELGIETTDRGDTDRLVLRQILACIEAEVVANALKKYQEGDDEYRRIADAAEFVIEGVAP